MGCLSLQLLRGFRHALPLVVLAFAVSGCFSSQQWGHARADTHVVRSGETLFTIAFRYGKDYRDLARWNRLGDGSLIYPGQVISLVPPPRAAAGVAAAPAPAKRSVPPPPSDPPPAWSWPTNGRVVAEFGSASSASGLVISGKMGQPVRAAAAGRVVYSGGGLIGYGQLIIIKHNETYLSAYGYNASLLVREGASIRKGQTIATMGEGPGQQPRLHFEIRRNGKPVNPRQFLSAG